MSRVWTLHRRRFLQALGGSALGLAGGLHSRPARAAGGARRIVFFYFPDGVAGPSQNGDASKWHCSGGETSFSLSESLSALEPWRDRCMFFNGLSMGGTDSGSHPGGAKKLLTAADYGNNESIDQYLSRTVGAGAPWQHLYLGAQATLGGASGDKHIVYPVAGTSMAPEDDPRRAFERLFGVASGGGGGGTGGGEPDPNEVTVVDSMLEDLNALRSQLGAVERDKLDLHLESLQGLERRIKGAGGGGGTTSLDCSEPSLDTGGLDALDLTAPESFPAILTAQLDLTVLALACGMTQVATVQCSHHTSELIMSRFAGTAMHDPGYDMRSHQASHYGSSHDWGSREFTAFMQQRDWYVQQFAGLLARLDAIPEDGGTMLDHSLVVLCTEVCDGNTHLHDHMPFVVAGGGGGAVRTGRLFETYGARHGDLWIALAQAMGADLWSFGDASSGPLSGVLA